MKDHIDEPARFKIRWDHPHGMAVGRAVGALDHGMTKDVLATRLKEVERFNRMAVNRKHRKIELKRRVNQLSQGLGQAPPYDLSFIDG